MRVLFTASELAPFAKTGGLADVSAALAHHLHAAGHDVRAVMPMYSGIDPGAIDAIPVDFIQDVPLTIGPHTLH